MTAELRFLLMMGTRPEAVKLARVLHALRGRGFGVIVCVTGQHRDLIDPMLAWFDIRPDIDLNLMQPGQTLPALTSALLAGTSRVLDEIRPDVVVVQGDTSTAFASALAAFYVGIRVAHVEAGLRTGVYDRPFPEEANRRMIAALAHVHFAPTMRARRALLAEGIPDERIRVTGNTGIDALLWTLDRLGPDERAHESGRRLLVTLHRREHTPDELRGMCEALRRIVRAYADVTIVLPLHLNPQVQSVITEALSGEPRIVLAPPLAYPELVSAMRAATLILTDSGGVQEEAPSLGKPVLVLRDHTERPEAVAEGYARVIGTDPEVVFETAASLLDDPAALARMCASQSPFGDGTASEQIADYFVRLAR
jgi:UDP-N-acetylglucosamine 2-epimerase (non-hydrolysing)